MAKADNNLIMSFGVSEFQLFLNTPGQGRTQCGLTVVDRETGKGKRVFIDQALADSIVEEVYSAVQDAIGKAYSEGVK